MSVSYSPTINSNGLILCLDASNPKSYPGSGNTWYDVSGNGNHFTINSTAYNSSGAKYMDFNGSYGCAKKTGSDLIVGNTVTAVVWTRIKNSTDEWRTLFRGLSSGNDHQVIIQSGGWLVGMYDNVNGTGFNTDGYSQQSLPGYASNQWNMLVWRWVSVQNQYYTYNLTYNDSPAVLRSYMSTTNARFKCGICSIGAYNNAEQNNPSTASQYWGDIGHISVYNRYLGDNEVLQNFTAQRGRFGI
jgi:hypothetical protein